MATITIEPGQEQTIVAAIYRAMAAEYQSLFDMAEKELERLQKGRWDRGFGRTHAPETVRQRQKKAKGTYYGKNAPNSRARPAAPYWEWTGALREATQRITRRANVLDGAKATIRPDENYRGPIRGAKVVTTIVRDPKLWDVDAIERFIERTLLDRWLNDRVLPRVERSFATGGGVV